jgi:hypothetical protein
VLPICGEQKFLADLKREGYTCETLNLAKSESNGWRSANDEGNPAARANRRRLPEPQGVLVWILATSCLQNVTQP